MHVSAIIAAGGERSHLIQSVDSALAQTHAPLEVVVVDGGATPILPDRRVKWVYESRIEGPSAARNHGVRSSRGEWIAFLESGDLWSPAHVATLLEACERQDADFGATSAWLVDEAHRSVGFSAAPAADEAARALWAGNAIGSPSSVIVRRSLWERGGGFDEWLAPLAAWDLWIRWVRIGRLCTSSEATVAHVERLQAATEELRELRRRYGRDAKAAGVRFGEGPTATSELAPPGSARPPWLSEASRPTTGEPA